MAIEAHYLCCTVVVRMEYEGEPGWGYGWRFYVLIYGVLRLLVAILGRLAKQLDEDASFSDGDGMH